MKAGDSTSPFRVVRLITRLNIGGPAKQALLLTRELSETYPTLLGAGIPSPREGELSDPAVSVHHLPLVRPLRPATDVAALAAVRSLLVRHRPQVLHTHMAKAGTVGRFAALSLRRRRPILMHTFHGHVLDGYFYTHVQRAFIEVERCLARHTDVLIAVSPQVRDSLLDLGIGTIGQYRVLPLGLDLDRFAAIPEAKGQLRKHLGLSQSVPLVGAVGRLAPIKDIRTLLAAIAILPGVHLALIGDGDSRGQLELQAAQMGLTSRVHFVGWYHDVPAAMSDLDVVALSSLNEGTPVAVIEALAAAKPVVATSVGGVSFVVEDGVTGLLVPKSDPGALAERIQHVLENRSEADAMAAAGRCDVMARFGYRRLVGEIEDLYTEMVGI